MAERMDLPVACTLTPGDGAERMRRWQRLATAGSPAAALAGDRLEVRYRPAAGVLAELRELARAETECCAFATWAVSAPAGIPTLIVSAGPGQPGAADRIAPIAALFGITADGPGRRPSGEARSRASGLPQEPFS